MSFNPDLTKQAVQVVFTRKSKQIDHPKIYFNNNEVKTVNDHKHFGLILDSKLSFISHINEKISKAHKGLGIIKSLFRFLSVRTLDLIFKLYIRPHLDFCDVIFHITSIKAIKGIKFRDFAIFSLNREIKYQGETFQVYNREIEYPRNLISGFF